MKSLILKLISVAALTLFILSFAACSSDKAKEDNNIPPSNSQEEVKTEKKEESTQQNTSAPEDGAKYSEAKVYEKGGVPHAKTESGQEVELSGESLNRLIAEYEKVKGTGSEKEKELLDKIQLILEAPRD